MVTSCSEQFLAYIVLLIWVRVQQQGLCMRLTTSNGDGQWSGERRVPLTLRVWPQATERSPIFICSRCIFSFLNAKYIYFSMLYVKRWVGFSYLVSQNHMFFFLNNRYFAVRRGCNWWVWSLKSSAISLDAKWHVVWVWNTDCQL